MTIHYDYSTHHHCQEHFGTVYDLVEAARANGTAVFVHCSRGISRSASLCIAYLMRAGRPLVADGPSRERQLAAARTAARCRSRDARGHARPCARWLCHNSSTTFCGKSPPRRCCACATSLGANER